MVDTELTRTAYEIAACNHAGQIDKAGEPYIKHLLAVAEQMPDEDTCVVALLHDIFEDTSATESYLESCGIPQRLIQSLRRLTRNQDVPYMVYIEGLREDHVASVVKRGDLKHNMTLSRLKRPPELKDISRMTRYEASLDMLGERVAYYVASEDDTNAILQNGIVPQEAGAGAPPAVYAYNVPLSQAVQSMANAVSKVLGDVPEDARRTFMETAAVFQFCYSDKDNTEQLGPDCIAFRGPVRAEDVRYIGTLLHLQQACCPD